jgi:hypothetical protein
MPSTIRIVPSIYREGLEYTPVNLDIVIKDSDFNGMFDLLEVWRSRSTVGGPYGELTSDSREPARIPFNGGDAPSVPLDGPLVQVVGKELLFILNKKYSVSVLFSGTDPLTTAEAAIQIAAQSMGRLRSYVDSSFKLVVETTESGTGASLEIPSTDAASILGLPITSPDNLVFGKDSRIQLSLGVNEYTFVDFSGSTDFYYKIRFSSRLSGNVGEFSLPFSVGQEVGLSPGNLVLGYLDLVDLQGKPLVGREVSLSSQYNGTLVEGKSVIGNTVSKNTNISGHVDFNLIRGVTYELSISGSNLVKTIIASLDPTVAAFPLLDANMSEQVDYFRVRVPQIPTLLRNV